MKVWALIFGMCLLCFHHGVISDHSTNKVPASMNWIMKSLMTISYGEGATFYSCVCQGLFSCVVLLQFMGKWL